MRRRVVITGMGAVSPIGNTVNEMWENATNGVCGIDFLTKFDTENSKVKIAAEIKNLNIADFIDKKDLRKYALFTQYTLIAADEAIKQSGITDENTDKTRCSVNIASGIGGIYEIEKEHSKGLEKGFDRVSPYFIPMAISNMASGAVAIAHNLKGSCISIVTACASSTNSIGESFRMIRDGYAEVSVCGGTEASITELGMGGFTSLRALSESQDPKRASIPFDKERNGFVMGEGAGVVVLEEYEHAVQRGATILGEVVGYGSTCDAFHMTAPSEDGSGAARAMKEAMIDANLTPKDVGYINAHATSTPMNDKCETMSIKLAFGDEANNALISGTKSMTGHLLGAAGAVEGIMTQLSLNTGIALPTIGYKVEDEDCDLNVVKNEKCNINTEYGMSNSLGFGGHNASLIFKKV